MNTSMERFLGRACQVGSVLLLVGGVLFLGAVLILPPKPVDLNAASSETNPPANDPSSDKRAQALKILADSQFSQTILRAPETVSKPKPPALERLIRVKGILDFGKPGENEALIESLGTRTTSSYKVGDQLAGVDAQIKKIGATVTFLYAGESVELDVYDGSSADGGDLATPESRLRTADADLMQQVP